MSIKRKYRLFRRNGRWQHNLYVVTDGFCELYLTLALFFTIHSTENTNKHILYFHGGAYSLQASNIHWKLIDSIIKNTNTTVTFVDYPLAPGSCCINYSGNSKKSI